LQESNGEWQGNINELMEALDMSLTKRAYLSRLAMLKNDYACLFEPEIDGGCIFKNVNEASKPQETENESEG
jgi:hypothetical protein